MITNSNIVAIIQARMGSKRLPNKVMLKLGKKRLIDIVYERSVQSSLISNCIVATTKSKGDDKFCNYLKKNGIDYFRGSEDDVLSRFYYTSLYMKADFVVRLTCDDPFKDPAIIDKAVINCINKKVHYCSNTINTTYAEGMDVECFSFAALEMAFKCSHLNYHREHVTPYIYENPEIFKIYNFCDDVDYSRYRLTLDDKQDWIDLNELYKDLGFNYRVEYSEIKKFLDLPKYKKMLVGRIEKYAGFKNSKGY